MPDFSSGRRRVLLTGSSLLLTACGSQMGSVDRERSSQLFSALARLDGLAEAGLSQSSIPGLAVAVVSHNEVVYLKGYGQRRADSESPVDADTVFQLASVSKPIASTVMAALVSDGTVRWDDPVIMHAPGFALSDPHATRQVTLRDMFCHRSGLAGHAGDLLEDIGYSRDEILFRLRHLPIGQRFRASYAYTNFGLTQAAVAASRARGLAWESLAEQRLFRPAGMHTASFRHADFLARQNRASLHVKLDGRYTAKFDRDPDAQSPAGGGSASVRDMARWLQLHLNNGKLDGIAHVGAAELEETRRPQIEAVPAAISPSGRAAYYALGWNAETDGKGRLMNGHSGGFLLGAATNVLVCAELGLGIVTLTNAWPVGIAEAVNRTFMELALDGEPSRDWLALYQQGLNAELQASMRGPSDYGVPPAAPAPGRQAGAYTGDYQNAHYGAVSVVEEAGALRLLLGPRKTPYAMRHFDGDTFVYEPAGENAITLAGVAFAMGDSGKADRLRIEYFDQHQEGDFARIDAPQA
jgi:CubicO group peptidase (beta-lactamase class C family)